jgi:sodium-dependent dicarboxylate transporter 2/3/5
MASAGLSDSEEGSGHVRRTIGLWLGPVVFFGLLLSPLDLPVPAHRLAAIAGLMMVWWITEALPLAATALLGPALAVALGIASPRDAFAPFGDSVIFLFLGSFLLAEALRVHGLDKRIALWVLTRPGAAASPARARMVVGLVAAAISMWINNTATAAMMLPIALGLVRALMAAGSRESPRGTILVVGIAASLGGIATPVGTAPNLIALGFLERMGERSISFLQFMAIGFPLSLVLLGVTFLVLRLLSPGSGTAKDPAIYVAVAREASGQPAWNAAQTACSLAFGLAVAGWLVPGFVTLWDPEGATLAGRLASRFDESIVAILAAALLFAWPAGGRRVLTWEEGARIDWGTLLLFGGGLAMGKLAFDTGLAVSLSRTAIALTGVDSLWELTALALGTTILLTEVASNTATVSMMAPVVLAVSKELGVPVAPPLLAVCFGASMGFMFPMGTPPNAMVYGTGLVPLTAMMRVGIAVDILSFLVILGALRLLCPLLGFA